MNALIDDIARFDAGIEVMSKTEAAAVPLQYALSAQSADDAGDSGKHRRQQSGAHARTVPQGRVPDRLEAFHDTIVNGAPNRTPPSDSRDDIALFSRILAVAKATLA